MIFGIKIVGTSFSTFPPCFSAGGLFAKFRRRDLCKILCKDIFANAYGVILQSRSRQADNAEEIILMPDYTTLHMPQADSKMIRFSLSFSIDSQRDFSATLVSPHTGKTPSIFTHAGIKPTFNWPNAGLKEDPVFFEFLDILSA